MVKQVVFFSDFYQSFLAIIVNTISSWELDAFDARVMLQYMWAVLCFLAFSGEGMSTQPWRKPKQITKQDSDRLILLTAGNIFCGVCYWCISIALTFSLNKTFEGVLIYREKM